MLSEINSAKKIVSYQCDGRPGGTRTPNQSGH